MKIDLSVEQSPDGAFFGTVTVEGNLIIEEADSLDELQESMKKLIAEWHNITDVEFNIIY